MTAENTSFPYIHGFNKQEQERLRKQAEFGEFQIYQDIDFTKGKILEVGCGVGAQTEILLRRFPKIELTGIDMSEDQIAAAEEHLFKNSMLKDRVKLMKADAQKMPFQNGEFDGVFLCWILEHVKDPLAVLKEVRRVTKPEGKVFVTEVMNSTFFLNPYSPNVWKYWMAFNDYQYDGAGDPFIGAKLGNLLSEAGFKKIKTNIKTWFFDNRQAARRKEAIEYWTELLLSAADQLVEAKYIDSATVAAVRTEMQAVHDNSDAVFMFSFMQASAT